MAQWLSHLSLHLIHLVSICLWAGVVLSEGVLELSARSDPARAQTARVHYLIDLWLELPLLVAVLVSGALLALSAWPLGALHWIKIAAGAIALGANFYCVAIVIRRHHRRHDRDALVADGRRIRWSTLGVPFGAVAATIGLYFFHA